MDILVKRLIYTWPNPTRQRRCLLPQKSRMRIVIHNKVVSKHLIIKHQDKIVLSKSLLFSVKLVILYKLVVGNDKRPIQTGQILSTSSYYENFQDYLAFSNVGGLSLIKPNCLYKFATTCLQFKSKLLKTITFITMK